MEPSTTQQPRKFAFSLSKKAYILLIGIIGVVIIGAMGFLTYTSTPGDVFYKAKVYVAENIFSATKVTEKQQFNYGVELLDKRLEELKTMSVNNELTEVNLAEFDVQFEAQVQKIDQLLNSEDAQFDAREIFDTTNHMVSIVTAAEQIMDNTEYGASDKFGDVYRTAKTIHSIQLDRIVSQSAPEEMIEIIQEKLTLITEKLEVQNQSTKRTVQDYLIDASEALRAQDFGAALEAVGSAIQLLEVRSQVNQTQG